MIGSSYVRLPRISMQDLFEIAAGSMIGRDHFLAGKNNQDSYHTISSAQFTIGIVCDGCGGSKHSEVGAKIGAVLVAETIRSLLSEPFPQIDWQQIQQVILTHLKNLAQSMGENFHQILNEYFLFTIVGILITPTKVTIFSVGDGIIIVNGKVMEIGPFPDNAPPYLTYGILHHPPDDCPQNSHLFQIHQQLPLEEVESILIGTDGAIALLNSAHLLLPGKSEPVGSISQFWQEDRYFRNPDLLRRKLALINRQITQPDWHNHQLIQQKGLLADDTTLIVMRKRKKSDEYLCQR